MLPNRSIHAVFTSNKTELENESNKASKNFYVEFKQNTFLVLNGEHKHKRFLFFFIFLFFVVKKRFR